jgi:hypothetical protein
MAVVTALALLLVIVAFTGRMKPAPRRVRVTRRP